MANQDLAVVGAGVIGLSAGVRLLEAGFAVTVYAAATTPGTTSDVAGAYWYPYGVAGERVERWARATYEELERLAADPATGVSMRPVVKLFGAGAGEEPWWGGWVRGFEAEPPGRHPVGYVQGYRMLVPLVEPPVYMPWLAGRFRALGGRLVVRRLASLDELPARHPLAVCCAGLGARELAGDGSVVPVRGRVVLVRRPAGLGEGIAGYLDGGQPTYIVPRRDGVLLGGTWEPGETSTAPDPEAAAAILRRCATVEPRLAGAEILSERAGLRPVRPSVRLELEERGEGRAVIHDYGHGGAGFTLSWGSADEVVELARGWSAGGARPAR